LNALASTTGTLQVWDHGVAGCPLSRGGVRRLTNGTNYPIADACAWWGTDGARQQIAAFHPDVVLVVAGINDLFDRELPGWTNYRSPGDPVFDSWVLGEYLAAFDALHATGAPVVWLPPPCLDWGRWQVFISDGQARQTYFGATTIPALAADRPVVMGDLDHELCPSGTFDPNALGIPDSRPDGLHLTDQASGVLATTWLGPLLFHAAGR